MVEVAYDENLSDFCLKSNHFLEIPELQREFVWEEKNVKTLLRDMKFHQINSGDLGEMFLGPIIIHYKKTTHHDYEGVIPKYRKLIDPKEMKNLDIKKIGEKLFPNEVEDCTRKERVEKIENVRKRSELIDGQQRLTILTILSRVLYSKFEENSDIAIALKKVYTHTSGKPRLRHKHQADGKDYRNIFQHHDDWVQKKQRADIIFNESKEKVGNLLELIELDKNELEELQKEKEALAEAAETAATDARQAADDAQAAGDPDAANLEDDAEAAEADAERARNLADEANKATEFTTSKALVYAGDTSKELERIKITTKRRTDPAKSRIKANFVKVRRDFWSKREKKAREAVEDNADPIEDDLLRGIHTVIASACKLAEKAAAATEATAIAAEAAEEAAINWSSGKQEWPKSKEDNYFRLAYDVINEWVDATDNADERENANAALRDAKNAGVEATNARQAAEEAQASGAPNADDLVEAANTAAAAHNDAKTNAEQAVEVAEKAQLEELEKFSTAMLDIIELVTIQISNPKQVHLAFRSLNSLGKVLTDAEKIKNELFSLATLGGDDTGTKNNWNRLVQTLKPLTDRNRNAKNDFLFVYCRSKGITHPPSRNTSKLSKQDVHAVFADPNGLYDTSCHDEEDGLLVPNSDKVSGFTSELADYADGYYKVRYPEVLIGSPYKVKADQVNEIVDLSKIFTAQLRPYFLAAFMKTIGQKEILELNPSPQKTRMTKERTHFKRLIRAISTAAVRVAICDKKRANDFEQDINRWVGYIANNPINTAIANIEGEVKALINKHWADDGPETEIGTPAWVNTVDNEFANYLSDELILQNKSGNGPDIPRAKYLIRGCEGFVRWSASKQLIQEYYSQDMYTVEHILPKSVVNRWGSDPADVKGGPWGQEWEELDRATLPDTDRAWPESKKEMKSLRFRLGNHLLMESRVNSKASTKTWAGRPNHLPLTNTAPVEPFAQWGKYHVYWSLEWWETDELEEEGEDAEKKTGSHLRGVKEFCDEHRAENRWTKELLEKRGKGLAEKAKKKKEWKLW